MLKAFNNCHPEAGTDEAGRGCLAGPVTAAAVILPQGFRIPGLNDSKKLGSGRREELAVLIREGALSYGIAHVGPEAIDDLNILNASIHAMHLALDQLGTRPDAIAVDGNRFKPYSDIPYSCLVKGDAQYMHIAAASILAKTSRDSKMRELHEEYPQYGWARNKGYPTAEHREAIRNFGTTPWHRKSFRLLPEQMKFPF